MGFLYELMVGLSSFSTREQSSEADRVSSLPRIVSFRVAYSDPASFPLPSLSLGRRQTEQDAPWLLYLASFLLWSVQSRRERVEEEKEPF